MIRRASLLALVLLAATFSGVAAQADSLWLGRSRSSLDAANLLPFDQALGLYVTIPKLDVTNDEVATGASAGQTGALSKTMFLADSVFTSIKLSAGRFYGLAGAINGNAAIRYFKIFDTLAEPDPSSCTAPWTGANCPVLTVAVPASLAQPTPHMIPGGMAMTNGIWIICVTSVVVTNETHCLFPENLVTVLYK